MTLQDRITEILNGNRFLIATTRDYHGWKLRVATLIAQAAQEHYRPRIETVEQLKAIKPRPDLANDALIRVPSYPFFGAVFELNDDGTWNNFDRTDESEARIKSEDVPLPVELLWSPGAGE